jgi:NNP family nitrate/nitrite transporter-like MFS transporter
MAFGVVAVLYFLAAQSLVGFFLSFMVLFLTAGIGNGSTYRMIPSIFRTERERETRDEGTRAEAARLGQKEASFVLGFAGAIGAYGGFLIPQAYKYSIGATGGPQTALITFIVFYITCIAVTWWFYYRRNAEIPC